MAGEAESLETNSSSLSEDSLNISFENITYCVRTALFKSRKTILNNVSGQFNAGELTVIFGQSGAGKSSLMDILSGYTKQTSGNIYINGKLRNINKFKQRSCYIFQDDKIQETLTVEESLEIAAEFKLGKHISKDMKRRRIDEVITSLSLEEARNTRAGNLSGGQKKRLAIGLELISDPQVMFLDEPTSGLDSSKAKQLVYLLHLLARQGRTVIITLHQPSAALMELVDRVYAVVGGHCAYMGSVPLMLPYLAKINLICPPYHNPIDFLIEICADNMVKLVESSENGKNMQWIADISQKTDLMEKNSFSACDEIFLSTLPPPKEDATSKILLAIKSTYCTSRWKQFTTLTKRSLLTIWRDPSFTLMITGIHCFMALFVGFLYYNIGVDAKYFMDNYRLLYFSLMFNMFTAFSAVTITFPEQIPIVRREHFNRWYSAGSYYGATLVSLIPTQTICSLTFACIAYFLTGQPHEILRLSIFCMTVLMVSYTALCLGLLNGSLFDIKNGVVFGPLLIMPFTIFSGFFLRYNDAPFYAKWLFHLSFLKHGLVGMVISVFGMDRAKLDCNIDLFCYYTRPSHFIQHFAGMKDDTFSVAVLALLAIKTVIVICTFITLKIRLKNKW